MRPAFLVLLLCSISRLAAAQEAPRPSLSTEDKTLYTVSTAHLDTQWRWTIVDTISQFIPNTLRTNFAHFERSKDYTFSFEGAFRYMLMREYYPEDYERLKQYIAQGRWCVAGASVDAGDVNMPSPESLIRHILYGNGFFEDEFSRTSADILLPDCFGFSYALPTIAAHCGLLGFSTQKLSWGSAAGVPFSIGTWEGPDGRSIVAALEPGSYGSEIRNDLSTDEHWLGVIDSLGKAGGVYAGYKYFGVGDTGGGPDEETIRWLDKSIAGEGPVKVRSAASDQLFRDLTQEQKDALPHYKGELLMTTHATGCYTSQAAMKRWNRQNELLADAAERAAVAADWLGGAKYPAETLTDAWVRFLWHQFHDDLTGTSIPEAYAYSWNDELLSQNQFSQVLTTSAGAVARTLDTNVTGVPIVVYNPLSIDRQDLLQAAVPLESASARVYGPDGAEVPSQTIGREEGSLQVLFSATVPSVGFSVYEVRPSETACDIDTGLSITETGLENARYRVALDEQGDVASVYDKAQGAELLGSPMRLELLKDQSAAWPAWEVRYEDVAREPAECAGKPERVRIVESGPARVCLELTRYAGPSTVVQRLELGAGQAGDQLRVNTRLGWQTKGRMLKAAFPLAVGNEMATYDLGTGTIQRGNNTPRLYEVPAQQWADITAADGSRGVSILNDCRYGWDKPDDGTLRLTLVRTPKTSGNFRDQASMDLGRHQLTYALYGHSGDWAAGQTAWQAARLNQPLLAFSTPRHPGPAGRSLSMLRVSDPRVAVRAVKQARKSDEVIVRLQELSGRQVDGVTVSLPIPIASAREVTGAEQPLGPATVSEGKLSVDLSPYEPRTFALTLAPPTQRLSPAVCEPVSLPYSRDVVSPDSDRTNGDLDGRGHSLPAELFPQTLTAAGIAYTLGPTGAGETNAVACEGQTIPLQPGSHDRLYLLAASSAEDVTAAFTIGQDQQQFTIPSCGGFIAQWDSRLVNGKMASTYRQLAPAYIKRQPVAWIATHRHNAEGGDDPYAFGYLFTFSLQIPKGATSLTLPNDPRVLVFAATLATDPNGQTAAAQDLYDRPVEIEDLPPVTVTMAPRQPENPADVVQGLKVEVFEGDFDAVERLAQSQPARIGQAETFSIPEDVPNERFGLRFTGYIDIPQEGLYTFSTASDDGSKLYIGDTEVVDNDGLHSHSESLGEIALAPGRHAITVLYFQGPVDKSLEVLYEGPGVDRQPVPGSALWRSE